MNQIAAHSSDGHKVEIKSHQITCASCIHSTPMYDGYGHCTLLFDFEDPETGELRYMADFKENEQGEYICVDPYPDNPIVCERDYCRYWRGHSNK